MGGATADEGWEVGLAAAGEVTGGWGSGQDDRA